MSDRKQALIDLLELVTDGVDFSEVGYSDFSNAFPSVRSGNGGPWDDHRSDCAIKAYNGSLDAAKALQEAVLGGWRFHIASEANGNGFIVTVSSPDWGEYWVGHAKEAARAWLIAVLKALIEQESKQ